MPLVTTTEMFKKAYEGGYAVGAFNVNNMEIVQGIVDAAKEEQSPLILQVSAGARKYAKHIYLVKLVEAALEDSNLPIALHLDHGDSFEICKDCVDGGFTSVMIDASHLPYEENVAITQKVVAAAHPVGVSVEAELGTIGDTGNSIEGGVTEVIYTDPDVAQDFVERTGTDSLAVAIGTAHGIYPKNIKPHLRHDILEEITKKVSIPLVLHGGSSNPDEEIAKAVKMGINKINISSDIKIVFANRLREQLNSGDSEMREPNVLFPPCMLETKKVAEDKIRLFNSANKAQLYYQ